MISFSVYLSDRAMLSYNEKKLENLQRIRTQDSSRMLKIQETPVQDKYLLRNHHIVNLIEE